MPDGPERAGSHAIPFMRYHDAEAAMAWLCANFGFERHLVVPGENGTIRHAQLTLGTGMIMLGTTDSESPLGQVSVQPDEHGGRVTQGVNLVVADADAVHERALAAGADILSPIDDMPFGGRAFLCRDPEGHVWNIGTYDPWA